MLKVLAWIAGVVGVLWFVSQEGNTSASSDTSAGRGSGYSTLIRAGTSSSDDDSSESDDAAETQQAKQEFEDAAKELRTAVDDLQHNRWSGQMSTIRSRLEDADDALTQLEALRPNSASVHSARDEVDNMRGHLSRLGYENWRTVRPDLATTAIDIEDEASSVSANADDE